MLIHDLRKFPTHQHLRALGLVFLGSLCAVQVAQSAAPSAAQIANMDRQMMNLKLNTQIARATSGSPGTFTPSRLVGNIGLGTTLAGDITLAGKGSLVVASAPLVVDVQAKVLKSALLPALGRFLGKVIPIYQTGVALYDLAEELGYKTGLNPDGTPKFWKEVDSQNCYSGTCYEYSYSNSPWSDLLSTCASITSLYGVATKGYRGSSGGAGGFCEVIQDYWNNGNISYTWIGLQSRVVPPSTSKKIVPYTKDDVVASVSSKNDWDNNTTKLPDLFRDLIASGETAPQTPPVVSGPASTPGTTTTTINEDNSTTTTNTSNNFQYAGDAITYNTTTTVTNNNPVTNTSTTSTSTTTNQPPKPQDPVDPCKEKPDSLGCSELDTPTGEIPKSTKTITFEAENLGFGGGSCPTNKIMTLHGMAAPITLVDWQSNCTYITTYAKPMILALATFAALMIIFAGGRPE
jgi:hypothetical protein